MSAFSAAVKASIVHDPPDGRIPPQNELRAWRDAVGHNTLAFFRASVVKSATPPPATSATIADSAAATRLPLLKSAAQAPVALPRCNLLEIVDTSSLWSVIAFRNNADDLMAYVELIAEFSRG